MIFFFSRWSKRQRRRYEVAISVEHAALELRRERPPLDQRVELDEIQRVVMYKRDEWTTDLFCCEIRLSPDQEGVLTHEEMGGFEEAMAWLEGLPRFRAGRGHPASVRAEPYRGLREGREKQRISLTCTQAESPTDQSPAALMGGGAFLVEGYWRPVQAA